MENQLTDNRALVVTAGLAVLAGLFYWYITWRQNFWKRLGISGPKPWFLLGDVDRTKNSLDEYEIKLTKKYGNIYGYYLMLRPVLTISEPELVKRVVISDFHHFVDRIRPSAFHKIMTEHLFLLEGERWKRVRAIVSPTFTSGKLRTMQPLMSREVEKLATYFDRLIEKDGVATINTKEVITGFTIDVIAATTFATETNANGDRSGKNTFVENGIKMFELNPLKFLMFLAFPKWFNINVLGLEYLPPKKPSEFFMDLTRTIVQQRKSVTNGSTSANKKRNDLVQLLLDASVDESELRNTNYNRLTADADHQSLSSEKQETSNESFNANGTTNQSSSSQARKLTENEVIAQCIIFFIAGFETTATTISNLFYELAQNPDAQQQLYEELCSVLGDPSTIDQLDTSSEDYHNKVVNQIPYLEAVIKETLRKYPPVVRLNRTLGSDRYQLTDQIELKKGQMVEVPVYSIHHNPEYYPEPERFNPDRFMPENQHLLTPYTYLPFGTEPRNCIGMRFAYQEIKLLLAQIIPRYVISTTANTPDRLKFQNRGLLMWAYPFELSVTKRQSN